MNQNRRAKEIWQKRLLLEGLLTAWLECPEQRLGQLITNATGFDDAECDLFFLEDLDLGDRLLDYRDRVRKKTA